MSKKSSPRKAADALKEAFAYFRAENPRRVVERDAADTALDQMYAYFA